MPDKVKREYCANCEGTGQADPNCVSCEGAGWVEDDEEGGTMTCPECDDERCMECEP